jgi:trimethylamine-N-oxide reductase (cytochrome c)
MNTNKLIREGIYLKALTTVGFGVASNPAMVYGKDGRIVRVRPLHYDWKYKQEQINPWLIEARGKIFNPPLKALLPPHSLAYKLRVNAPTRVRFPLKRVDWDPNGERNPQNRGKSKFVRISWEEAIDIIVGEIKRIMEKYGPYAIVVDSEGHASSQNIHEAHGIPPFLLQLLGGCTLVIRNPDSWEGWAWGAKHVWGMDNLGMQLPQTNLLVDVLRNTELLLFWGCDLETTPWGFGGQFPSVWLFWFRELGIKKIFICPDLNYSAAIHADKWIPIKPNTDAALQLAIAYIWITEDTYDKEYIQTHTVGFEKFKWYVLGEEDGVPKTPKWAEGITGVPSRAIKALAREWASKRTSIVHFMGGGLIRGPYSTEPARLEVLLLAMQGLGKPGANQFHMSLHGGVGWITLPTGFKIPLGPVTPPSSEVTPIYPVVNRGKGNLYAALMPYPEWVARWAKNFIPKTLLPDAILNPPISFYGTTSLYAPVDDQFIKYVYPSPGYPEARMLWFTTPCWMTCWNNGYRMVDVYRNPKIEFIIMQHPWLENDTIFADLILPVTTKFEVEDIAMTSSPIDTFALIIHEEKCIDPVGESKSDYEICCEIAKKFGVLNGLTEGNNVKEWIKFGYEISGADKYASYEEFIQKGYAVVPTFPEWKELKPGLYHFYENPKEYPLWGTPSGKIEFCSQNLAKYFPEDQERPPVPHWIPHSESHQESLFSQRGLKYPFLMVSNHPRWRMHAQHDDIPWMREIPTCKVKGPDGYFYEPVWIHPHDASKFGIKHGDIVKVYNDRGAVLFGAYVTERIMPGALKTEHGARTDLITDKLDRGGAINLICPSKTTSKNACGMVVTGYLVAVEKVNIEELKRKYPEHFLKPYDPVYGSRYDAWVVKKGE